MEARADLGDLRTWYSVDGACDPLVAL